ncbi:amino-acid N-acetyltransferase [Neisseria animalis]|uniref:Amino-acid acetyltransferase n=1 Tax=Neisseria animalis TaxID=492 RepID=A0A5P3MQI8_NEIAN|nr:amino-acid N-acetyltransferase [Neisseria animalis]QEY23700.1 amino-acid N-acetyltransferase [Neisseria animalis]ROW32843.1 amino-acid N-acetyltransferase [Neisseria animalis]VEE09514.1 N-acetylglutamate synthase [Neisseria animalis]
MNTSVGFVGDFREAAPYINYLRGKTLVIGVAGSLLEGDALKRLAADLNLLASLGVRLVLVHGSRKQIDGLAAAAGSVPQYHQNRRITDETTLQYAKQAAGMIRCDIEAALGSSIAQFPQRSKPLAVAGGNFLSARPLGVIDGIDMGYTGVVRKIDTEAVRQRLDNGALVLISPIGHSPSGKTFNLSMGDIAEAAAIALQAEKLVYLIEQEGILDEAGRLQTNLSSAEARKLLENGQVQTQQNRLLHYAVHAVEHGVSRTQVLSGRDDGALIRELFTRHGAGTSIARDSFVKIRQAHNADIPTIMALIRPLEEQGILLRRSREYLENQIHSFSVLEHDRHIYGCVALKTFEEADCGELACLVVSPDAQEGGYGEKLLSHLFAEARARGMKKLFALSTHTGEWFAERGFQTASLADLPEERRRDYLENGRNSQIFVYIL